MRAAVLAMPFVFALTAAPTFAQRQDSAQGRAIAWSMELGEGSAPGGFGAPFSASLVSLQLRWERSIVRTSSFELRYAPTLMPYVSLRGAIEVMNAFGGTCLYICAPPIITLQRKDGNGVGVAPIALRAEWRPFDALALSAGAQVAALVLDAAVPFNRFGEPTWLLDGSLGARVRLTEGTSVSVEWVRSTLANGPFVLDERAFKTSGVRVGLVRSSIEAFPLVRDAALGRSSGGWVVTVGAGGFSPLRAFETDAQMTTLAWRWERAIAGDAQWSLAAGIELLPVVIARARKLVLPAGATCGSGSCPVIDSYTTPAIGVGASPFALRASATIVPGFQLWIDAAAGGVAFDRPFPVQASNSLNLLLSGGGGVSIALSEARTLTMGYRIEHLSNGYTADRNPGVNFHAIALGLQLLR